MAIGRGSVRTGNESKPRQRSKVGPAKLSVPELAARSHVTTTARLAPVRAAEPDRWRRSSPDVTRAGSCSSARFGPRPTWLRPKYSAGAASASFLITSYQRARLRGLRREVPSPDLRPNDINVMHDLGSIASLRVRSAKEARRHPSHSAALPARPERVVDIRRAQSNAALTNGLSPRSDIRS